jgi:hypothetical protein
MSEQTARLVDRLRARLKRTVRRVTLADVAFGAAVFVGTLAAAWLLSVAVEAGLWLGTTPRTALALVMGGVALVLLALYLAKPLGRLLGLVPEPPEEQIARTIGAAYPEVSDRLLNLLQLAEGQSSHAPAPLVDQAVQRLAEDIQSVPFEEIEDFTRARKAVRLATLPVVGVLAFLLVAPSTFLGASERLLAPQTHFQRPAPFQLTVQPGNVRLVKGDSLQVTVHATGERPDQVVLATQARGEQRVETVAVAADSAGVYRHTVAGLREAMQYRVQADPVQTAWYDVEVMARPLVRTLQVKATPPSYTGLPTRTLDPNVGNVTGLPGTRVSVEATLGGPEVEQAVLQFDDGRAVPLTVNNGTASGSFPLREEGTYSVRLRSTEDVRNRDPIRYDLAVRADAQPSVSFLAPEPESTVDDDLVQRLRLRLSDDFGFSQLRLYYRLAEQRFGEPQTEFASMEMPMERPRTLDQEVVFDWLLAQDSGLDLVPGDVVEYYVRVWDNDAVAGYKAANTAKQRLRLPSLAESFERLDEEQQEAETQMEDLQRDAEEIDRQFRELRDELRSKQQSDWEDQRQLQQIQEKQKSLDQKVDQLSKQMQQITQQMQEENLTSPETAQKYQELQRVIEEIDSPELQKALQKLQESMKNMDMRQMQKAMEDFEFNEQQYQQRLQRALDLFKNLKAQQKIEEMARRAGELSDVEKQLAEETKKRLQDADNQEPEPGTETDSTGRQPQDPTETDPQNEDAEAQEAEAQENDSAQDSTAASDAQDPSSRTQQPDSLSAEQKSPSANEDLAREQERAAERMRELMKEMQKAAQEMKDVPQSPQQKMQNMQQQMQQQNLPKQMQKNAQQLRQQQMNEAQQGQQQMQQQLQQMQQRLQQMKKGMQGQQMQINMAGLQSALDNILRLSQDQESLRQTIGELSSNSPTLRQYAQDQKDLSTGLQTVSDSLQKLARRIPQMSRKVQEETGNALREMESATTDLSERSAPQAGSHQKGSMMHLNELALMLSDLLSQMQNASGSGSGMSMQQMMQQMQKMSGQQQKLNRQIQQFLNDVQGNRLSTDQQERLQQLAKQQQRIQQQLKDLAEEGGANADQVLGDLNKIAEQMEKTIQELQQGRQNERTIDRQRQILTRMLQAQQSLRTQGKKPERKGRTSDEAFNPESPDELSPQEQAETLRRDLIRALESGYAPDYEELIKRYFELLQQQQSGN